MYVSIFRKNEAILGTSLTIQWLELSTSNAGVQVQSLVRELRSHMPWGAAIKKGENKAICISGPRDYTERWWLRAVCAARIHDLWRRGFRSGARGEA